MSSTKFNWILLVLFCVLTVIFCIGLIISPANGDRINMLGRIGLWLGVIANAMNAILQVFEIRSKNRGNNQQAS
jgi:succinate-acetate transporter protein